MTDAIKTLGQGLPPLPSGKPDMGVRQDLFHLFNCFLEELADSVGLKAKKGIIVGHDSLLRLLPRCFPKLLHAPKCFCMLLLH